MFPYWLLFATFAFGAVSHQLTPRTAKPERSPLMIVSLAILIAIVGLRFEVGGDWAAYVDMFDATARQDWGNLLIGSDPGYMLVNGVAQALGGDIWLVNLICGMITVWGLAAFAHAQPNPWLTIAIAVPYFIIVVAMGYVRQATAIGFILAAFGPFERRQYIRFGLLFLAAASFHKTAVVVLPLIALAPVRDRFLIYAGAAAFGAAVFSFFLSAFLDFFFRNYLDAQLQSGGAGIRVSMNLLPAILFLIWSKRLIVNEQERLIWRNFSLAALVAIVGFIMLPSSTVVDRLALYLSPLQFIVLSRLPYAFPNKGRRNNFILVLVIAYCALIQFVWLNFSDNADAWLPYRFYPIS